MSPLALGTIPFGIIFGTLAVKNGLTLGQTMALSLFVFAGSAQFIAIGLFAAAVPWQIILLTTFIVNLRHLLYAATIAPQTLDLSRSKKAVMAFLLTDEAFAVTAGRYAEGEVSTSTYRRYMGAALTMYGLWQSCSLLGALFGNLIPGASEWGLDFAMPVTFIGMLVPYLRSLPMAGAAATAAVISILAYSLPNKLSLIAAACAGIALGTAMDSMKNKNAKIGGTEK